MAHEHWPMCFSTPVGLINKSISLSKSDNIQRIPSSRHGHNRIYTNNSSKPHQHVSITMQQQQKQQEEQQEGFSSSTLESPPSVVIAGGSGFIGRRLCTSLIKDGIKVTVLTRDIGQTKRKNLSSKIQLIEWDINSNQTNALLENAIKQSTHIINLCGQPIITRWTINNKRKIYESRTKSTKQLIQLLKKIGNLDKKQRIFINTSAVGFYGTSQTRVFDETSTCEQHDDFLVNLCNDWEKAITTTIEEEKDSMNFIKRWIIFRFGIVLGLGGGVISRMLPIFNLFIGGPILPGNQWISWIHIDDLITLIRKSISDHTMNGIYNATAPNPITMNEMSSSLAKAISRPNLFPVPAFLVKLALGEGAQVVLEGQRVIPKRLLDVGHQFKYPHIDDAMKAIAAESQSFPY